MPARNSIEKVVNDLNERAKPFNLSVIKVEHYQNVRNSKIVLMDTKNKTKTKSLEKWREFFNQLSKENTTNLILFPQSESKTLEERVLEKAKKLKHNITNFVFQSYRDASCAVYCTLHDQTFEHVKASYYVLSRNKHGIKCCSVAFKEKRTKNSKTYFL